MLRKFAGLFVFILLSAATAVHSQENTNGWMPLLDFCQTNKIQLSFNLNLGYANLTRGGRSARVFLTVPYVVSGERAYFMQTRLRVGPGGELELPDEYADKIRELLGIVPAGPAVVTNRIVGVEEVFVTLQELYTNRPPAGTNAVVQPRTNVTVPPRTNVTVSNNAQNNSVSYNNEDGFQPITAVIIDPGHGGRDPGGMSASGLKEKDIVLAVCKQLKSMLSSDGRYSATMTRSSDVFVTLEDRTKIARDLAQQRRAVFVSVHANISLDSSSQGVEVYSLSDHPSDDAALDVERMENAGFSASDIRATEDLYSVLADLVRDGLKIESEKLAASIYNSVVASTGAQKRGLKQAAFYVLKYNSIPSVLIEIGFLSNAAEAKKMNTADYQKKLARGIFNGIVQFIDAYNRTRGFSR